MSDREPEFENRVVVVGVGLIGGSVAAAIRQRFPACEVIGVGRSTQRLAAARSAGLITAFQTEWSAKLLAEPCMVVFCLPVHLIAAQAAEVASLAGEGVLITDAGSVKGQICNGVAADPAAAKIFVGAHPIAGGEQGGFEYAEADLFDGKVCVVVPSQCEQATERTSRFWSALGCRIIKMSAEQHDRALAYSSHLPHLMAAATAAVVSREQLELTGSGFRDTTRIAAGDASLWRSILAGNRREVALALRDAEQLLAKYRQLLEAGADDEIESLLQAAAVHRQRLNQ